MNLRRSGALLLPVALASCSAVLPHPWPREALLEAPLPLPRARAQAGAPKLEAPQVQAPDVKPVPRTLPAPSAPEGLQGADVKSVPRTLPARPGVEDLQAPDVKSAPRALPGRPGPEALAGVGRRSAEGKADARFPQPDPEFWLSLLLKGYDAATHHVTSPAIDGSGAQVRWDTAATQCVDPSTALVPLPDRPVTGADVVVSEVDPHHLLVWIPTSRYAGGDALGPVALVEARGGWAVVEVLGALRANPERARLGLLQASGTTVLVAEGESCRGADVASCQRSARVMALVGSRFQPSRIVDEAGACLGAGWLQLDARETEKTGVNRERRYRLDASLGVGPEGLKLVEQVTVHDRDARQPTAPERLFRRAEGTTVYRIRGADLVGANPSLWSRLLRTRE